VTASILFAGVDSAAGPDVAAGVGSSAGGVFAGGVFFFVVGAAVAGGVTFPEGVTFLEGVVLSEGVVFAGGVAFPEGVALAAGGVFAAAPRLGVEPGRVVGSVDRRGFGVLGVWEGSGLLDGVGLTCQSWPVNDSGGVFMFQILGFRYEDRREWKLTSGFGPV
jgi:hypothetical protein